MLNLNRLRIATKLPLMVTGSALILAIGLGITTLTMNSEGATASLNGILHARKESLTNYLVSIQQDLNTVSTNPFTHAALSEYKAAWAELGDRQTEKLQKLYIEENPNPTGQKENLDYAPDGSSYSAVHKKYHKWFRHFLRERGYYDIFLFDLDGNLLYTVFKELDYATNLNSGRWKDSDLGNVFRAARDMNSPGEQSFFDFKAYAPSNDAPASFIATPIFDESGQKVGVLAFQMPVDAINAVMAPRAGLGETGETLIVGSDYYLRNDSSFSKDNDILAVQLKSAAVDAAIRGEDYSALSEEYRGVELQTVSTPFEFAGTKWALVAVQSVEELSAAAIALRNAILMVSAIMLVLIGGMAFLMARSITRPMSQTADEMRRLADGDVSIDIVHAQRHDELGDMSRAVQVFKDNAIERMRLESEQKKEQAAREARQQRVDELINGFRGRAQELLQAVSANMNQMQSTAQALGEIAENSAKRATDTAASSEEASTNVQTVASAAEELAASIEEISRKVSDTTTIVGEATEAARTTNEKVSGLDSAAQKIGDVVSLIQDIAEQTNLLALNATIEAARAGEAGKGFAVVASEVKSLATQTARATEEISQQIAAIQAATSDTVSAIDGISKTMEEVNQYTAMIAAAVEEQGSATSEISRNVTEAADGTRFVAENMAAMNTAASDTNRSADEAQQAAESAVAQTDDLRRTIDSFLQDVAAA